MEVQWIADLNVSGIVFEHLLFVLLVKIGGQPGQLGFIHMVGKRNLRLVPVFAQSGQIGFQGLHAGSVMSWPICGA